MIKKLLFYLIMLMVMLALLELFAFVVVQLVDKDDFFDSREGVLERFSEAGLAEFRASRAVPTIGWGSRGPMVREKANCIGEPVEYHFDAAGARLHNWFDAPKSEIIIVGDSYTNGDEAGDSETYPARLAELLGVSVANHGVGGYGPVQSLLNLQENIARYPQAKVAVLGIMYENLYRMVNSYRPVLYSNSSNYTLKPYMSAGQIVPHPGSHVFDNLDQFNRAAVHAFENDFWAKPVAEFPYLVALGRAVNNNYFYYRRVQRELSKIGLPEYFLIFEDHKIKQNLIALLNQYTAMAGEWGVQPVVLFIPRNRFDTSSAARFVAQHRSEISPQLLIGDVGEAEGVDWVNFNLREEKGDNICHPSLYGYQAIAQYIAEFLRTSNAWQMP